MSCVCILYVSDTPLFPSGLLGFSSLLMSEEGQLHISLNITSCKMFGKNLAASIDSIKLFFLYVNCNPCGSGERVKSL